jgi:hypothetical protein
LKVLWIISCPLARVSFVVSLAGAYARETKFD